MINEAASQLGRDLASHMSSCDGAVLTIACSHDNVWGVDYKFDDGSGEMHLAGSGLNPTELLQNMAIKLGWHG
jgi:hypothetical protein